MMRKFEKLSGVTVLVAESDRSVRENLAAMLQAEGAEVKTSYSGKRTLELLMSQQPDVLLCGVSLSDMAGCTVIQFWRALESARGARRQLCAIAVTLEGQPLDLAQAYRVGFNNLVGLEGGSRQIIATIEKLISDVRKGMVRGACLPSIPHHVEC